MSDKTFRILLTIVNALAAAVIIASAVGILGAVREAAGAAAVYEATPPQRKSDENIHNYFTTNDPSSQESDKGEVHTEAEKGYVVSAYRGHVAVFREGETLPWLELNILLCNLTPEDETILTEGIRVGTPEEVFRVLKDYDY